MDTQGRALVTGASRGIERAVAVELASRGFSVTTTVRDPLAGDGLPEGVNVARHQNWHSQRFGTADTARDSSADLLTKFGRYVAQRERERVPIYQRMWQILLVLGVGFLVVAGITFIVSLF